MNKTLKTYMKRLRVTKNGKILGRKEGQDHFNAKASGKKTMGKKGSVEITMTKKSQSRFLS
jgi:ribosomal protein L35